MLAGAYPHREAEHSAAKSEDRSAGDENKGLWARAPAPSAVCESRRDASQGQVSLQEAGRKVGKQLRVGNWALNFLVAQT